MTYEEREKILCNNCEAKENCSYINRNLERKCSFRETTMYGWELGYNDAIDKACKWLKFNYAEFTDNTRLGIKIDELVKDFKKDMKGE